MRGISMMLLVPLAALSLTLSGCGRSNIFSSAHRAGESTDTRSLEADGYAALQNKDYATAITCYSKILESEPSNAEALYGYSAAKLADAGLDIGELVANLIREQESGAACPGFISHGIRLAAAGKQPSARCNSGETRRLKLRPRRYYPEA